MRLTCDSREPWPHPWQAHLPPGWHFQREGLETGDLCIARLPTGILIERKTAPDLAGCIGRERERFERELKRSRYAARFLVIVEGSLQDVCRAARGIHPNAVIGTLAAWSTRYCPFIFAGSVEAAADFAFRALASQVRDATRTVDAVKQPAPLTPERNKNAVTRQLEGKDAACLTPSDIDCLTP